MDTIKGALDAAKQAALGQSADAPPASGEPSKPGFKTAPVEQTGPGVVRSLEEAGHRAQEQQGADNPGFYKAQAKLADAVQRGNERLSGGS